MKAVYGLYPDGHSAQQAVNRLRAAGIVDREITVISSQPMDDYEFGSMDRATWMWWFACLGGLIGMSAGFGLAWLTETSWPLDVGGLPIFAWWPNLIIIFELTMLGAITATVSRWSSRPCCRSAATRSTTRRSPTARFSSGWKTPPRERCTTWRSRPARHQAGASRRCNSLQKRARTRGQLRPRRLRLPRSAWYIR